MILRELFKSEFPAATTTTSLRELSKGVQQTATMVRKLTVMFHGNATMLRDVFKPAFQVVLRELFKSVPDDERTLRA